MNEESPHKDPQITWWTENSPNMDYGDIGKLVKLREYFDKLEAEGKIGNRVADIACGPTPASMTLLHPTTGRKLVQVDVMNIGYDNTGNRYIRYDINDIADAGKLSTKKALIRAATHFGIDPRLGETAAVDTMLFFDILNYVDYKAVLSNFARYLKPGGRFIILNMPQRHPVGKIDLLSPDGASSNLALESFLSKDFEIEKMEYPWGLEEDLSNTPGEDLSAVFIVARKK